MKHGRIINHEIDTIGFYRFISLEDVQKKFKKQEWVQKMIQHDTYDCPFIGKVVYILIHSIILIYVANRLS
jgi:hypothetical protein